MPTLVLIARREFVSRVRSRIFVVGTALMLVLLVGVVPLQKYVFSSVSTKVGYTADAQPLVAALEASAKPAGLKLELRELPDLPTGERQVRAGNLDAVLTGAPSAPELVVNTSPAPALQAALDAVVKQVALSRSLAAAGVDQAALAATVAAATPTIRSLKPGSAESGQRMAIGILVSVVLYVALVLYGQFVAMGVVEEKSSRVVEILLSAVRPRQLLLGKVVGIGLVGLFQLLIIGAVGLSVSSRFQLITVPNLGFTVVLGGLLWFVLGFGFYAILYAAAGALVSRQEEVGVAVMPLTALILVAYLTSFWAVGQGGSTLATVLSMLPPFAPQLMPLRMATGDAPTWQWLAAAGLMLLACAGSIAVAARIYENSILRLGARVGLREAFGRRR